jgi:hypothetical protein
MLLVVANTSNLSASPPTAGSLSVTGAATRANVLADCIMNEREEVVGRCGAAAACWLGSRLASSSTARKYCQVPALCDDVVPVLVPSRKSQSKRDRTRTAYTPEGSF